MNTAVGKSIPRKEAWDKVTGRALYTDDLPSVGVLCARLLTSTAAHAKIVSLDVSPALAMQGVKSVVTGADCALLFGPLLQDRPALARETVRCAGEPVAIVVAQDEMTAERAARAIKAEYEPLPVLLTPSDSLNAGAPLLHPNMCSYKKTAPDVSPESGTNIASRFRTRKGDADSALKVCPVILRQSFRLPPSDHTAMEVRTARAEIKADGNVIITTSSQSPYAVRKQLSETFQIPSGSIEVRVPFVGGGFGGKAPVTLEILAYLASESVGGREVRLTLPREQDMASMPSRIGFEADITLGASKDGTLEAAELVYRLDCGAYTDISPYMTKAAATDCTGPYRVENLSCDALCVYTNHTYATSYRSFAHESYTFCMERAMDMLAKKLNLDPLELRLKNAIRPGDLTPSRTVCSDALCGNLSKCIEDLKPLCGWNGSAPAPVKENTVRAKGVSCFWKTENPPTDAVSGALITFNPDGSMNLNTGVVEIGSADKTHLTQILAEKLGLDANQVHAVMPVDTRTAPEHWKTVASLTEYMTGQAVMRAADDIIAQLKANAAQALCVPAADIEVSGGRVYCVSSPDKFILFKDVVQGFKAEDGSSVGEPVLGRGGYMLKGLTLLDPHSGAGKTGPAWTVGAQAIEIEADLKTCTYRILNASTVIDIGRAINPALMRALVAGGMAMGMSLASRESFVYGEDGVPQFPNLRTYKLMHFGQEPDYRVGFVETPEDDSPYGVRSYSEHGLIGIPAALANALSAAFGRELNTFPLTPELIWRTGEEA